MKFVVISDLHIGGKFNEAMYIKGVDVLNNTDADYYICAGDLTDQGTVADYELATKKYLPMIKKPIHLVPGNHDAKNVGDILWEEILGPRFFVLTDDEKKVKILGLDSNEPDQNTGRMGDKALSRIYEEFADLDDSWLKVLVFHHQTLPIRFTGRERSALVDAGDTVKAIMDCNVDLVINGHRHISNVYQMTDGDVTTLLVNAGTISCKKTRYREEYSITKISINKKQTNATVEIMQLNEKELVWTNRFNGSIKQPGIPDNLLDLKLLRTIVHLGNTDFSNGQFNMDNLVSGIQVINTMNADIVIHTGDVTAHSYKDEFDHAIRMLQLINKPKLIVPGPNDSFPLGYELYEGYFGTKQPTYEDTYIKILGFDTCVLDEKIGRLGRGNTSKIIDELGCTEKIRTVVFHHSIIPLPRSKHESELQDAGDVLASIVDNNIDLVLSGAKNRAMCWQVGNTVFINTGTLSSKNIVTAKGNSFNIIQIYETAIGKFIKIDEFFIESGELEPLGRLHLKKHECLEN
ncbi:MAG: metallophosphoesterase [Candidatus Heimdallarchaeota archaeon]|nr:metallophosphoesterase [Candidatus Heimdallarchaeota archaeon]